MQKFLKLQTKNEELNRVQGNVEVSLNPIIDVPILNGVLVSNVGILSGSDTYISHKLGRRYRGFLEAGKTAEAIIWESGTANNNKERVAILRANVAISASFWFF